MNRIRRLKPPIELSGIFHRHETAQDADDVLDCIEPDTLVFREGYMRHDFLDVAHMVEQMADIRLREGEYTSEAKNILQAIKRRRKEQTDDIAVRSVGFAMRMLDGVAEKNCPTILADYTDYSGDGLAIDNLFWVQDDWARLCLLEQEPSDETLLKILTARDTFWRIAIDSNDVRENSAIASIYNTLGRLAIYDPDTIERTSDGRPVGYLTYGLAHRNSMTERLYDAGLGPEKLFMIIDKGENLDQINALPTKRRR